jgi:hypothetical protein
VECPPQQMKWHYHHYPDFWNYNSSIYHIFTAKIIPPWIGLTEVSSDISSTLPWLELLELVCSTEIEVILPLVPDLLELDNGTFSTAYETPPSHYPFFWNWVVKFATHSMRKLYHPNTVFWNLAVLLASHAMWKLYHQDAVLWNLAGLVAAHSVRKLYHHGTVLWNLAVLLATCLAKLCTTTTSSSGISFISSTVYEMFVPLYPFFWARRSQYAAMTQFVKSPCEKMYPSLMRRYWKLADVSRCLVFTS